MTSHLSIQSYDHAGIRVSQVGAALKFYGILGFTEQEFIDGAWELRTPGGVMLNLVPNGDNTDCRNILQDFEIKYPGITHVALSVSSVDEALAECARRRIAITEGPKSLPGRRYFFIRDPDGNVVELTQRITD